MISLIADSKHFKAICSTSKYKSMRSLAQSGTLADFGGIDSLKSAIHEIGVRVEGYV